MGSFSRYMPAKQEREDKYDFSGVTPSELVSFDYGARYVRSTHYGCAYCALYAVARLTPPGPPKTNAPSRSAAAEHAARLSETRRAAKRRRPRGAAPEHTKSSAIRPHRRARPRARPTRSETSYQAESAQLTKPLNAVATPDAVS